MSGVVVWMTGLPASGKSSLARRVAARLRAGGRCVVELDGDELRERVFSGWSYDEDSRARFYEALAQLAAHIARQRVVVLVPATAHRRAWRKRARDLAPCFVEVHVATSAEVCAARDPRGLYRRARAGEVRDFPGVGVPYEAPEAPELVASGGEDADALEALLAKLEEVDPCRHPAGTQIA
jgi:adenylylsulfate kinase